MPAPLPITRPREEYAELVALHRHEPNAKVKQRMAIILARWEGRPVREIATHQRFHRATVHRWVKQFNQEGVVGLYDRPKTGRPRKFDWEQLRQDLHQSPEEFGYPVQGWTRKLVLAHLNQRYGVSYHPDHLYYLFRQLGFRMIMPRPRSYRTTEATLQAWKKK